VCFGSEKRGSIHCRSEHIKRIRRCARNRETEEYQNLAAWSPPSVGIDGLCRRSLQVSASDFTSLAAMQEGKIREKVEGSVGFI
jgi:hypothetical protein